MSDYSTFNNVPNPKAGELVSKRSAVRLAGAAIAGLLATVVVADTAAALELKSLTRQPPSVILPPGYVRAGSMPGQPNVDYHEYRRQADERTRALLHQHFLNRERARERAAIERAAIERARWAERRRMERAREAQRRVYDYGAPTKGHTMQEWSCGEGCAASE